ncbi:LrgB family protein [Thermoflavimicrobium daqui]|uniref:CidB/LrgB family autolysis modulator n=1 Tax=Thermoflavimicrobium daqui TaxID=2137476 RepID=A0A364K4A1_9BACL|nr:LrgB family protein [Thermoflavimicrobium daqui]RAL24218.1 CidB/LrgB family autolysis modulator [Thermoflavimicrobium daqui]
MGNEEIFSFLITLICYMFFKSLYHKKKILFFSPVLICPILLIFLVDYVPISYQAYEKGTQLFTYLLQPATVAFAIPMVKHWQLLKRYTIELLSGVIFGSTFALFLTLGLSTIFHFDPIISNSLAPRSITTPFAVTIASQIGGNQSLSAAFVILTGVVGMVGGTWIIRLIRIQSPLAKGVMFGVGSHGIGTSKAFELGESEGTFSSLAMILSAVLGMLLIPIWVGLFIKI